MARQASKTQALAFTVFSIATLGVAWAGSVSDIFSETGRPGAAAGPAPESLQGRHRPGAVFHDELAAGIAGPEMVVIQPGEFRMGDNYRGATPHAQAPVHQVRISAEFAVGKYEVTFADYDRFVAATGSRRPRDLGFGRGRRPVIDISWKDARAYVAWLSEQTGARYRLLSEAEWEYVARTQQGLKHRFSWGNYMQSGRANCKKCGVGTVTPFTWPVGSFKANAFGLYDVNGNVWEWVEDCWHVNYVGAPRDGAAWIHGGPGCEQRVRRGGSWKSTASDVRPPVRQFSYTTRRRDDVGFRVARDLRG